MLILLATFDLSLEIAFAYSQELLVWHVNEHESSKLVGFREICRDRAELHFQKLCGSIWNEALRDQGPPVRGIAEPFDSLRELEEFPFAEWSALLLLPPFDDIVGHSLTGEILISVLDLIGSLSRKPVSCDELYVSVAKLLKAKYEEVVVCRGELASVVVLREVVLELPMTLVV